ncbi:MAG: STAS domain-containing protein [Bacillota bacterium]
MADGSEVPLLLLRGFLLVPIQTELHDQAAQALQRRILEKLEQTKAEGLLIDVTALTVVDSFLGRLLRDTAVMARMMGALTVLVGLRPAVAITLSELGLDLPGVHTDLDLERGLAWLEEQRRRKQGLHSSGGSA